MIDRIIKLFGCLLICFGCICEAMTREDDSEIYGGDPSSKNLVSYVYLCSRLKEPSRAESLWEKLGRDWFGIDGCCDCCEMQKKGLFVAVVTVDSEQVKNGESDFIRDDFEGMKVTSKDINGKVLWCGAIAFFSSNSGGSDSEGWYAHNSDMKFDYAYNHSTMSSGQGSTSWQYADSVSEEMDEFVHCGENSWLQPKDNKDYPHIIKEGKRCTILNGLKEEGLLFNILKTALFRWRLPDVLTISKFLHTAGLLCSRDSDGYCIAPKYCGTSKLSSGYNCIAFCNALLAKLQLVREKEKILSFQSLCYERKDFLKQICKEESDIEKKKVLHSEEAIDAQSVNTVGRFKLQDVSAGDADRVDELANCLFLLG